MIKNLTGVNKLLEESTQPAKNKKACPAKGAPAAALEKKMMNKTLSVACLALPKLNIYGSTKNLHELSNQTHQSIKSLNISAKNSCSNLAKDMRQERNAPK